MGLYDLNNLRAELRGTLGRDPGTVLLNRWTNFGYLALARKVDFEILYDTWAFNTAIGTFSYPNDPIDDNPSRYLFTLSVFDDAAGRALGWTPLADLLTYDFSVSGTPKRWSLRGAELMLHPKPSAARAYTVTFKQAPTHLVNDTDVTVLSSVWDSIIVMLAAAHAFSSLNEESRAAFYLNLAQNEIQTTITEGKAEGELSGLGKAYPDEVPPIPVGR